MGNFIRRDRNIPCIPNCPERRPGCQDHCEYHRKKKAENERRKEFKRKREILDSYEIARSRRIHKRMR